MFNLNLLLSKEELNSKAKSMDQCLEGLFHKRGSTREMALAMLVDKFCKKLQNEFLVNNTLLYQCFNSVKRGSSKEIYLASRLIGFVSITIGCKEDLAHKVLEDAFPPLSEALRSKCDPIEISSLLDCLASITFVGGDGLSETERSMQLMWQFFHPKLANNMVAPTPSAMVLTTALSAWSFLLSTMDVLKVDKSCWKESVSYFSDLLDHDDLSVRLAAAEAIALIFEMGSLEKFCCEAKTKSSNEQLVHEGSKCQEGHSDIEGLKGKILNQMTNLSLEAGDEVVPKNDSKKKLIDDVLRFLEDNVCLKTSLKVGRSELNISTWSRLLQVNFMVRFLGPGFLKHMQENEFLHDVFDFKPKDKQHISSENQLLPEMFTCDHEEVVLKNFYQAKQWELEKEEEIEGRQPYQKKKTSACPNPALKKAKKQVRKQNRLMSQTRNAGHMAVGLEGEDLKDS